MPQTRRNEILRNTRIALDDVTLAATAQLEPTIDWRECMWCNSELPKVFRALRCPHCGGPNDAIPVNPGKVHDDARDDKFDDVQVKVRAISKDSSQVDKLMKRYAQLKTKWENSGRHACGEGPAGCFIWGAIMKLFVREGGLHLWKELDWTVVDVGGSGWGAWYTLRECEHCGKPDVHKGGGYI